jgi:Domain of unknown function DUF29
MTGQRMSDLYDTDFLRWTEQQARMLRRRAETTNNDELDYLNLAEEIESAGASQKRDVRSGLALIFQYLLKWRYQPDERRPSWERTLLVQRRELRALFEDSPSLRSFAEHVLSVAFTNGRQAAEQETGPLGIYDLPPLWSLDQALDPDFLPDR